MCSEEGLEGVKWELGFGQFFTGKMRFGSLGLEITNKLGLGLGFGKNSPPPEGGRFTGMPCAPSESVLSKRLSRDLLICRICEWRVLRGDGNC